MSLLLLRRPKGWFPRASIQVLGLVFLATVASVMAQTVQKHLRYNRTPSLPTGLYWLTRTHNTPKPGQYIAFCPPNTTWLQEARRRGYLGYGTCPGELGSMLKVVAAVPGDRVRIDHLGVWINNELWPQSRPLRYDEQGRPLPQQNPTSYIVPAAHFLALSRQLEAGFDGRYFGPVPVSKIEGLANRIAP